MGGPSRIFEALEDAGSRHRDGQLHRLPGTRRAPLVRAALRLGSRPAAVLLLQRVRVRRDGCAALVAESLGRDDRRLRRSRRRAGSITRDGFDFLLYYLSDYDWASHAQGPDEAFEVLARCDASIGALVDAAGGLDEFLARYALVVLADHGQSRVRSVTRLEERFAGVDGGARRRHPTEPGRSTGWTAAVSMPAGWPGCSTATRRSMSRSGARAPRPSHARRARSCASHPLRPGGRSRATRAILGHPDGLRRAWTALANPNAGELLVSPVDGVEFADLGGRHHLPGGSHGSLLRADSEVPVVTIGVDGEIRSIVDLAPLVLRHFGVTVPAYARGIDRAA